MVDIAAVRDIFEKWGGSMVILLNKTKVNLSEIQDKFPGLSSRHIFAFDRDYKILKQIEKLKGHELNGNLPVIVVSDVKGNLIYFSEGYKIGVGEQIAKTITWMK